MLLMLIITEIKILVVRWFLCSQWYGVKIKFDLYHVMLLQKVQMLN